MKKIDFESESKANSIPFFSMKGKNIKKNVNKCKFENFITYLLN